MFSMQHPADRDCQCGVYLGDMMTRFTYLSPMSLPLPSGYGALDGFNATLAVDGVGGKHLSRAGRRK